MAVVIVIVVAVVLLVAWLVVQARGGTPEDASSHRSESEPRADVAGRSVAGPADAGAEAQRPVTGDPAPG